MKSVGIWRYDYVFHSALAANISKPGLSLAQLAFVRAKLVSHGKWTSYKKINTRIAWDELGHTSWDNLIHVRAKIIIIKGMRREGNFSDAAFLGPAISYTLGRVPVNMPGAIVSGDGAFARRLYRRTPEQTD